MWNPTDIEIEIYFFRHGMTKGNLEKRYIGTTDEELCPEGRKALENRQFPAMDAIFISPKKRCRQSAEILFPHMDYRVVEELSEIDFGVFEGKNYLELNGDAGYQNWIDSGGAEAFPGGESREAFILRSMKGFSEVLSEAQGKKKIAIVAHGGTIMAILSTLCKGEYYDYQIKNAEAYHFLYKRTGEQEQVCDLRYLANATQG